MGKPMLAAVWAAEQPSLSLNELAVTVYLRPV